MILHARELDDFKSRLMKMPRGMKGLRDLEIYAEQSASLRPNHTAQCLDILAMQFERERRFFPLWEYPAIKILHVEAGKVHRAMKGREL
jgi:hypothetical protein